MSSRFKKELIKFCAFLSLGVALYIFIIIKIIASGQQISFQKDILSWLSLVILLYPLGIAYGWRGMWDMGMRVLAPRDADGAYSHISFWMVIPQFVLAIILPFTLGWAKGVLNAGRSLYAARKPMGE